MKHVTRPSISLLKTILCMVCCGVFFHTSKAQSFVPDTAVKSIYKAPVIKPKKLKAISKEWSIGARLATDGWTVFADFGKVKSEESSKLSDMFYDIRLLQFEISEKKHIKETKTTNEYLAGITGDKPKPFIYGKLNNFYAVKAGYGFRKMIAGKPEPNTISIHWMYLGGLSIGLEKPYYLDAYVYQDGTGSSIPETIRYQDDTKEPFLQKYRIIGPAGWSKGLSEIKIVPGIYAKTGLHFDFSNKKNSLIALETGVSAELYTRKIQLMANQKATPLLLNGYISLQFGKRR